MWLDGLEGIKQRKEHSLYFEHLDVMVNRFKAYYAKVEANLQLIAQTENNT